MSDLRAYEEVKKISTDKIICLIQRLEWEMAESNIEIAPGVRIVDYINSELRQAVHKITDDVLFDTSLADMCSVYIELDYSRSSKPPTLGKSPKEFIELLCSLIGISWGGWCPDLAYMFSRGDEEIESDPKIINLFNERMLRVDGGLKRASYIYRINAETIDFMKIALPNVTRAFNARGRCRLANALNFYVESCLADSVEEAIIHIVIVMESLFGPHDEKKIAHTTAEFASMFLKLDEGDKVYELIKNKIYKIRSQIVHGDRPNRRQLFSTYLSALNLMANSLWYILSDEHLTKIFNEDSSRHRYMINLGQKFRKFKASDAR